MSLACDEVKRQGVPMEEPLCACGHGRSQHVETFFEKRCTHRDWWGDACSCEAFAEVGK